LTAKTSELEDIQKDPCWAEDSDSKARAKMLISEMEKLSLFIADMQRPMERLLLRIQKTERQRDLLLAGREAPRESV
jgi:hypothetical protein